MFVKCYFINSGEKQRGVNTGSSEAVASVCKVLTRAFSRDPCLRFHLFVWSREKTIGVPEPDLCPLPPPKWLYPTTTLADA